MRIYANQAGEKWRKWARVQLEKLEALRKQLDLPRMQRILFPDSQTRVIMQASRWALQAWVNTVTGGFRHWLGTYLTDPNPADVRGSLHLVTRGDGLAEFASTGAGPAWNKEAPSVFVAENGSDVDVFTDAGMAVPHTVANAGLPFLPSPETNGLVQTSSNFFVSSYMGSPDGTYVVLEPGTKSATRIAVALVWDPDAETYTETDVPVPPGLLLTSGTGSLTIKFGSPATGINAYTPSPVHTSAHETAFALHTTGYAIPTHEFSYTDTRDVEVAGFPVSGTLSVKSLFAVIKPLVQGQKLFVRAHYWGAPEVSTLSAVEGKYLVTMQLFQRMYSYDMETGAWAVELEIEDDYSEWAATVVYSASLGGSLTLHGPQFAFPGTNPLPMRHEFLVDDDVLTHFALDSYSEYATPVMAPADYGQEYGPRAYHDLESVDVTVDGAATPWLTGVCAGRPWHYRDGLGLFISDDPTNTVPTADTAYWVYAEGTAPATFLNSSYVRVSEDCEWAVRVPDTASYHDGDPTVYYLGESKGLLSDLYTLEPPDEADRRFVWWSWEDPHLMLVSKEDPVEVTTVPYQPADPGGVPLSVEVYGGTYTYDLGLGDGEQTFEYNAGVGAGVTASGTLWGVSGGEIFSSGAITSQEGYISWVPSGAPYTLSGVTPATPEVEEIVVTLDRTYEVLKPELDEDTGEVTFTLDDVVPHQRTLDATETHHDGLPIFDDTVARVALTRGIPESFVVR